MMTGRWSTSKMIIEVCQLYTIIYWIEIMAKVSFLVVMLL